MVIKNFKLRIMAPVTTFPERTLDIEDIPSNDREALLASPCTLGPAEDEPDSNPKLRSATRTILEEIGEDPDRVGLAHAAPRSARMGIFNERLYGEHR